MKAISRGVTPPRTQPSRSSSESFRHGPESSAAGKVQRTQECRLPVDPRARARAVRPPALGADLLHQPRREGPAEDGVRDDERHVVVVIGRRPERPDEDLRLRSLRLVHDEEAAAGAHRRLRDRLGGARARRQGGHEPGCDDGSAVRRHVSRDAHDDVALDDEASIETGDVLARDRRHALRRAAGADPVRVSFEERRAASPSGRRRDRCRAPRRSPPRSLASGGRARPPGTWACSTSAR